MSALLSVRTAADAVRCIDSEMRGGWRMPNRHQRLTRNPSATFLREDGSPVGSVWEVMDAALILDAKHRLMWGIRREEWLTHGAVLDATHQEVLLVPWLGIPGVVEATETAGRDAVREAYLAGTSGQAFVMTVLHGIPLEFATAMVGDA